MSHSALFWVHHLQLSKHIEGGYFSEVYKSAVTFTGAQLPDNFPQQSNRHACTHIYFLLEKNQVSALHRIKSDELWHFYAGNSLLIYEIETSGKLVTHTLGPDPEKKQHLFISVKAGSWFGAALPDESEYALVGCTVSPGFDYADFELAEKAKMLQEFPQHHQIINLLTP